MIEEVQVIIAPTLNVGQYFWSEQNEAELQTLNYSAAELLLRLTYILATSLAVLWISTMASIKANCRKVVCVGRNYAYAPFPLSIPPIIRSFPHSPY